MGGRCVHRIAVDGCSCLVMMAIFRECWGPSNGGARSNQELARLQCDPLCRVTAATLSCHVQSAEKGVPFVRLPSG